jgi:hypothetical protein
MARYETDQPQTSVYEILVIVSFSAMLIASIIMFVEWSSL